MKKIIVTSILLLISGLSFFCFTTKPSKVDTPKIKEKLKINISVMGDLKNEDVELVKNELIKFYDAEVTILPKTDLLIETKVDGSNKFNANKILQNIDKLFLNTKHKVLILTNVDISTNRELNGVVYNNWGIFGLARLNSKPCVVSTHRFKTNYKEKLIKVSIHEIGHTLGIPHCHNEKCIMTDAKGKGSTVDHMSLWMCNHCKNKIKY